MGSNRLGNRRLWSHRGHVCCCCRTAASSTWYGGGKSSGNMRCKPASANAVRICWRIHYLVFITDQPFLGRRYGKKQLREGASFDRVRAYLMLALCVCVVALRENSPVLWRTIFIFIRNRRQTNWLLIGQSSTLRTHATRSFIVQDTVNIGN